MGHRYSRKRKVQDFPVTGEQKCREVLGRILKILKTFFALRLGNGFVYFSFGIKWDHEVFAEFACSFL